MNLRSNQNAINPFVVLSDQIQCMSFSFESVDFMSSLRKFARNMRIVNANRNGKDEYCDDKQRKNE